MVKFLYFCGRSSSWVAKGIDEGLELHCHDGFFKELRIGNGVLIIQHHSNARDSFLQISNFKNGRRKDLLVVPKGVNGIIWKGFVQSIRSITGSKASFALKLTNRGSLLMERQWESLSWLKVPHMPRC